MNDIREIKGAKAMMYLRDEIEIRLANYKSAIEIHFDSWRSEEEAMLRALPRIAYNLGAITDSEKKELVQYISVKKEKIKEEIKYGCM